MSPRRNRNVRSRRHEWLHTLPFLNMRMLRRKVLAKYACLTDDKKPMVCQWSQDEIDAGYEIHGSAGKVMFRKKKQAAQAAYELHELGSNLLEPYMCDRVDDNKQHWHMRSVKDA